MAVGTSGRRSAFTVVTWKQGVTEHVLTIMGLGTSMHRRGFTRVLVWGLMQKSCRFWMPVPHETEHWKERTQPFLSLRPVTHLL